MKRILVVGGTGGTGKQIIAQALDKGFYVTAIVRKPDNIKINHPNLKLVQGDVMKPKSIRDAFTNQDAVISSLGHKIFFRPTKILSQGTQNLINAMKEKGINRFICITALGINDSRFKLGLYYTLFTKLFILPFYFYDKSKQEKIIEKCNLDWTIVRPGQLYNGKRRNKYIHGEGLGNYILTKMISRADVAHFILNELEDNKYIHKKPAVYYKSVF